MLSTPERRCILTNRVLPTAFLLKFKTAVPPALAEVTDSTGKDKGKGKMLVPDLLHPRFRSPLHGRSAWVVCREDAIQVLRIKGSYKRLGAQLQLPSHTATRVNSELIERVVQEIILLTERIKSKPRGYVLPFRRISKEEWDSPSTISSSVLIKLSPSISVTPDELLSPSTSTPKPSPSTSEIIRSLAQLKVKYDLSTVLQSVVCPRRTLEEGEDEPSLVKEAIGALEGCLKLFDRRKLRELQSNKTLDEKSLLSPTGSESSGNELRVTDEGQWVGYEFLVGESGKPVDMEAKEDLVPLLVALWRLRLWSGEGWKSEP